MISQVSCITRVLRLVQQVSTGEEDGTNWTGGLTVSLSQGTIYKVTTCEERPAWQTEHQTTSKTVKSRALKSMEIVTVTSDVCMACSHLPVGFHGELRGAGRVGIIISTPLSLHRFCYNNELRVLWKQLPMSDTL